MGRQKARGMGSVPLLPYSSSIQTVAYEPAVLPVAESLLTEIPQRGKRFFDLVLVATLKYHGISRLYTRNVKDFQSYSFLEIIDPI